jgi:cilia- and flagella-associated protein 44
MGPSVHGAAAAADPCAALARPPQGALGKFGGLELSDVAAFAELPDGKVLSGTEAGALLLWDGSAIKAVVARPGGVPCHAGAVEAVALDEATGYAVTGGADGVLRVWDAGRLGAEPGDAAAGVGPGPGVVEAAPAAEVALPPGTRVRGLLWLDRTTWLVADGAGGLLRVSAPPNLLDAGAYGCSRLFSCHAGGVLGLATLPGCHVAVAAAADGSVRALDYTTGAELQARTFGAAATCLAALPTEGACGGCFAVGFADGIVRRLQRCSDGWLLLGVDRPHRAPIVAVALAGDRGLVATVAADGTAFFFAADGARSWRPLGSCRLPGGAPTCADWAPGHSGGLLVGLASGAVVEVQSPSGGEDTTRWGGLHVDGSSREMGTHVHRLAACDRAQTRHARQSSCGLGGPGPTPQRGAC